MSVTDMEIKIYSIMSIYSRHIQLNLLFPPLEKEIINLENSETNIQELISKWRNTRNTYSSISLSAYATYRYLLSMKGEGIYQQDSI